MEQNRNTKYRMLEGFVISTVYCNISNILNIPLTSLIFTICSDEEMNLLLLYSWYFTLT